MNDLEKGIEVEHEHIKTIHKIMKDKKMSTREAAKLIALDHLKEDPKYYKKLEKIGLE